MSKETNETNGTKKDYRIRGYANVNINDIYVKEGFNPRLSIDQDYVKELGENIYENGLLTPIAVKEDGNGKFWIISGHCRFEAFKYLQNTGRPIETIAAKIFSADITEATALINAAIANDGKKLLPLEEAKLYWTFVNVHGWTYSTCAAKLKRSIPTIQDRVSIWNRTSENIKCQLAANEITVEEAQKIIKASTKNDSIKKLEAREAKNAWNMRVRELLARIPENLTQEFEDVINELLKKHKVVKGTEIDTTDEDILMPNTDVKFEDDGEDFDAAVEDEI